MTAPQPVTSEPETVRRPWYRSPGWVVVIVSTIVGLTMIPIAVGMARNERTADRTPQVKVEFCGRNASTSTATVRYLITNTGSATRDYRLRFEMVNTQHQRVGATVELVTDVAPGQAVRGEATFPLSGDGSMCRLAGLD